MGRLVTSGGELKFIPTAPAPVNGQTAEEKRKAHRKMMWDRIKDKQSRHAFMLSGCHGLDFKGTYAEAAALRKEIQDFLFSKGFTSVGVIMDELDSNGRRKMR